MDDPSPSPPDLESLNGHDIMENDLMCHEKRMAMPAEEVEGTECPFCDEENVEVLENGE